MKIFCTVSDQAWGGKHRYMSGMMSGLSGPGRHVTLLAERGSRIAAQYAAGGAPVITVPLFKTEPGPGDKAVVDAVRNGSPDLFIASGRRDLMAVHRVRRELACAQPFIFFRLSAFPLSGQQASRDVLSDVDIIVCTSQDQIDQQFSPLIESGVIPESKIILIRSGVPASLPERVSACDDMATREELGIGPDSFVFLVLSRLSWEKGVDKVIEAFGSLPSDDATLVITGEGPDEGALRDAATAAGVGARILFCGHVDDVTAILSVANAVVLGSQVPETGPLALKEAMAAGKPVIAPAVGGIPEFVKSGHNGLLYGRATEESLAGAMMMLIEQEDLAGALGRQAARTIRMEHQLERRVEHLAWLIDLLLVQRGSAASAVGELQWDDVRLRPEERFVYLFVPRTSQITELPPPAGEVVSRSVAERDTSMLLSLEESLRGDIIERLFRMGALRREVGIGERIAG